MKINIIILLSFLASFFSGVPKGKENRLFLSDIKVVVWESDHIENGDILVLPGYNFSPDYLLQTSDLKELAQRMHFRLIIPDMGRSIYAGKIYPETRKDLIGCITRVKLLYDLIPSLQKKYKLLTGKSFILGISTGARGAMLLAEESKLFNGIAGLSGDYDQTTDIHDKLITSWYGPYQKFPDRWKNCDNPLNAAKKITIPVYLAHGNKDKVVNCQHSLLLYKKLQQEKRQVEFIQEEEEGHDFRFWNKHIPLAMEFFSKLK